MPCFFSQVSKKCRSRCGEIGCARPAGTLKEWHWRALARAYAAGDEGLEGSYGDYANIGWNTWLRLRDYKRGALIEERASGSWSNPATGSSGSRYRIHITGAGWALYEREWARYRLVDCTNVDKSAHVCPC